MVNLVLKELTKFRMCKPRAKREVYNVNRIEFLPSIHYFIPSINILPFPLYLLFRRGSDFLFYRYNYSIRIYVTIYKLKRNNDSKV